MTTSWLTLARVPSRRLSGQCVKWAGERFNGEGERFNIRTYAQFANAPLLLFTFCLCASLWVFADFYLCHARTNFVRALLSLFLTLTHSADHSRYLFEVNELFGKLLLCALSVSVSLPLPLSTFVVWPLSLSLCSSFVRAMRVLRISFANTQQQLGFIFVSIFCLPDVRSLNSLRLWMILHAAVSFSLFSF